MASLSRSAPLRRAFFRPESGASTVGKNVLANPGSASHATSFTHPAPPRRVVPGAADSWGAVEFREGGTACARQCAGDCGWLRPMSESEVLRRAAKLRIV